MWYYLTHRSYYTTSLFSIEHPASVVWTKTTERWDDMRYSFRVRRVLYHMFHGKIKMLPSDCIKAAVIVKWPCVNIVVLVITIQLSERHPWHWKSIYWNSNTICQQRYHTETTSIDPISIWGQWLTINESWWRHQMDIFSALLAICAGNSLVSGEFPAQRAVARSFDVFFYLRLSERLSKHPWGWWLETPSLPLWRHTNGILHRHLLQWTFVMIKSLPWHQSWIVFEKQIW